MKRHRTWFTGKPDLTDAAEFAAKVKGDLWTLDQVGRQQLLVIAGVNTPALKAAMEARSGQLEPVEKAAAAPPADVAASSNADDLKVGPDLDRATTNNGVAKLPDNTSVAGPHPRGTMNTLAP